MIAQFSAVRLARHGVFLLASTALAAGAAHAAQDPATTPLAPAAAVTPLAHWSKSDLRDLLAAVDASADEGLRPADYRRDDLAAVVADGTTGPAVDALAEGAARSLAHDYADGRVTDRARFDWHIDHSPAMLASLDGDLAAAVDHDRVGTYLTGLLPQDPRYAALREALKDTPAGETDRRAHIRASMERWRWMPRDLGQDYVMVNVPAYRLTLFRDADAVATHDVVVGAPRTPTPMIATYAGSVVVHPWWTLPPSVLAEGKRYSAAKGYVYTSAGGRTVVRQKPGPDNALGQIKIVLDNPYAIYLHDTPAKAAFAKTDRALSHGCIRVKGIEDLADELAPETQTALADNATQTLQMEKSVPVYIVYFTAGEQDGRVVTFADPYGRDATLDAALDGQAVKRAQYVANAV